MINREPSRNLALRPRAGCLLATTAPLPGRRLVLAVFVRVLWATAFVLLAFQAEAGVVFTSLHSFSNSTNGANPLAGLAEGSDGNFYGTTLNGGMYFKGTVFKISTNGTLTSLYSFSGRDGSQPQSGLVQGSDGNFYGTTTGGGTNGVGTVFKISLNGVLTSLYSFTGGNDGASPYSGLAQGSDGDFYGTTQIYTVGPAYGTAFKISTNGTLTTLYSFINGNDGADPYAGLLQGSDGNFYGTTVSGGTNNYGTVFKISAAGALTSLHSFNFVNDGAGSLAGLVQDSDSNLYGTTAEGGTNGFGTVFKITTNGVLTSLYSFTGGNDGASPYGGVVQGSGGNFYGTTAKGGTNGYGTVFKVTPNGVLTGLHSFTGDNDGANPQAGLVQGSDGSFYGTTGVGGSGGAGTVFRLTLVRAATPVFQTVNLTNSKVSLSWSTEAAETYQLQYISDLSSSNWTNLGSPITATATTLQANDSTATNGSQRFYRVVLLP